MQFFYLSLLSSSEFLGIIAGGMADNWGEKTVHSRGS